MEFKNLTPFPAIAFAGIDQHDQAFHVLVLRQTLSFASGTLEYADTQEPLCEADEYFGEPNITSVRQESDLCQYKPKCDVIVNATAHAPRGKGTRYFQARLTVRAANTPAPLPEPPRGLNPFQDPSDKEMTLWRHAVNYAQNHPIAGAVLIDKTLTISGERCFRKKAWPFRLFWWAVKWASLWIIRRNPWKLTAPQKLTTLPLRYEYAFGGQCRINADEKAAKRVKKKLRLTPEQQAQHPDQPAPIAHTVCELNPLGTGYSEAWHLKATKQKRVPAPLIEAPAAPITAKLFWRALNGKLKSAKPQQLAPFTPAGFGVVPKSHPARRKLGGTIDVAFVQSDKWLPEDFDFGVWNAAPPDQQTEFLCGDEIIELTNLCESSTPGATTDKRGNTLLQLDLPGDLPFVLVCYENGGIGELAANLDTLMIDPERRELTCVWRATLASTPTVRVLEARMLQKAAIQALKSQAAAQETAVAYG